MALSKIIEKVYNLADNYHAGRLSKYYNSKGIDAVIDVGSHKGEFITKVVRDTTLPVFSFEPQNSVREELKTNTKNFNVLSYFDFALSDNEGEIDFHLNELSSTSSLFKSNENSFWIRFKKILLGNKLYTGVQKTKVFKLDDVLNSALDGYECILFKIDVEGAEASVLRGASEIMKKKNIHYVQIENANFNIYKNNNTESPFYYLDKLNYKRNKNFSFPFLNFSDVVFKRI